MGVPCSHWFHSLTIIVTPRCRPPPVTVQGCPLPSLVPFPYAIIVLAGCCVSSVTVQGCPLQSLDLYLQHEAQWKACIACTAGNAGIACTTYVWTPIYRLGGQTWKRIRCTACNAWTARTASEGFFNTTPLGGGGNPLSQKLFGGGIRMPYIHGTTTVPPPNGKSQKCSWSH